ncbi:hypothetical protein IP92_03171 [Pseudoduganella flava]|uniref:XRE family transcriptional regulator n=1 Tax=Pseudoduganella flava TaxID=871742 RepID=A0A562PR00_9BURK|nr:hypothetical protein [Pseudoduganella flava]QGZ37964.1 hypothetical protein GO485_02140 [Pseudoduganella flava]TWI46808.1 hypothetical protein IP92_03171 [Pseudoduganella flava]
MTTLNLNNDGLLNYDPNRLLDHLIERLNLKNDAALARVLEVAPPVISKIRHFRLAIGASLLIRMHEVSDITIGDLRMLMGDRRGKFRVAFSQNDVPAQHLHAA